MPRAAGLPVAGAVINGYNAVTADSPEETAPTVLTIVPCDDLSSVENARLGRAVLEAMSLCDWDVLRKS